MILDLLNTTGGSNKAGIKRTLYFALAADVLTWPTLPAAPATYQDLVEYEADFAMQSTKKFQKFEATVRKSSLMFESAGERGSKSAVNRIEVLRARIDSAILGFLKEHMNDEMVWIVEDLEADVNHIRGPGAVRRSTFFGPRRKDEPVLGIRGQVEWAHTKHGGKNPLDPDPYEFGGGCGTMGYCEMEDSLAILV